VYRSSEAAAGRAVQSRTGEPLCVRKPVDTQQVKAVLSEVRQAGIESIAVVLKHAALFPDHELAVGAVAKELGFKHVSLSHEVMPMVKMVARGFTAASDAYLTPHILKYLQTFRSGFDEGLADVDLAFMQSDGGLASADTFSGHKAILSGPAAGYVGYSVTTTWDDMPEEPLQARSLHPRSKH
jgi:5-oxoprolinase (ATP-hydrolysing)